jgi:hypothetical protein
MQGWVTDEPDQPAKQNYEAMSCLACGGVHLVNPASGKTINEDAIIQTVFFSLSTGLCCWGQNKQARLPAMLVGSMYHHLIAIEQRLFGFPSALSMTALLALHQQS